MQHRLSAGLEVQYTGRARTLPDRETRHADAFCIANFTLYGRNVYRGVDLSASVYNLFDTRYAYPGGPGNLQDLIFQDGRTFLLKATCRF